MKRIFLILFLASSLLVSKVPAQNSVSFVYDEAGNRISRTIVFNTTSGQLRSDDETTDYTEVFPETILHIYPNPTEGLLQINIENLPDGETVQIAVFTASGQLLFKKEHQPAFTEIDLGGQPAGIYLLKIQIGDKSTEWKIIKK
ncbi:MAG: T9SS type A sorting domain-containing protein [Dysgonamonadaceae bacterium]|jgi:hypothetical protein|nr:T9SS type A sorting domain-containing protein [Dysgonamonadaceae bacterium]